MTAALIGIESLKLNAWDAWDGYSGKILAKNAFLHCLVHAIDGESWWWTKSAVRGCHIALRHGFSER